MKQKILGISGSPVKKGNVEFFLNYMMEHAESKGAETEILNLSRLKIDDCVHCNYCIKKQKDGKYCSQNDDGQEVFEKIENADILVLSSPVYFLRTSARMAALLDRLRVFIFGNLSKGKMKNKIGISSAVAWARNSGLETTHLTHLFGFLTLEMIPVSVHHCVSPLGASAVSSPSGMGLFDRDVRIGVEDDLAGQHSGVAMIDRALELSKLINQRPD